MARVGLPLAFPEPRLRRTRIDRNRRIVVPPRRVGPRAHVDFEAPAAARLVGEVPVGFGNRGRIEHAVLAFGCLVRVELVAEQPAQCVNVCAHDG